MDGSDAPRRSSDIPRPDRTPMTLNETVMKGVPVPQDPNSPDLISSTLPSATGIKLPSRIPTSAASLQDATASPSASAQEPRALSPSATDRVFPIRSFVSVDPTPTPSQGPDRREDYFAPSSRGAPIPRRQSIGQGAQNQSSGIPVRQRGPSAELASPAIVEDSDNKRRQSSISTAIGSPPRPNSTVMGMFNDASSIRSGSVGSVRDDYYATKFESGMSIRSDKSAEEPGGLITARFKHVVTEGGHAIITGRDGDVLQRCEDEPIHIPGAVQSFGVLVALHEESEGKLLVKIVSENSKRILGLTPMQLFSLDSFTDILSEDQTDNLLDHIDFIKDEGTDVEANGPEVFTISVRTPQKRSQKLWCAIHMNTANPDLIICEFELEDDQLYPLAPLYSETPEPPEDTLQGDPTEEELKESTEAMNKPLRVLRSARKRRGEAAAMDVFNIMSQVQEQLAEAPTLDSFLKILVGVIKELTGFHRVMIYQFDQAWNGKVVTELVDVRATKDLYKGLHFPASDIPKQARDMYKSNKVRLLYDRDMETARLVCKTVEDLETPLDLTYSYLRAMSPIHIKYLANMAVRSSMSVSINAFGELWGLISCHAYGAKGTRVSFPIRKMCRLVGDSASRNIERLSYASRLQSRKLINTASTERNPSGYIIASSEDLLKLFNADFGLLSIHDETKILGKLEATQEALAMLEYLRMRRMASVVTSQDVSLDFPDLRYPPGFQVIAGLLNVPLSARGEDFIVFFRKGQLKEVKWAGNPYEKFVKEGTEGFLEPRKSFKSWSETVIGKCKEWTEDEVETAAVLCLVYGKFIEVWRQKEAALQNSQLTKLLLANSAHEVRTPLNAIINCLEIALEGSLDTDTRENLARSHSASKSLIYVINDLLDLTKTTEGAEILHGEVFDLKLTFQEATEVFLGDARRKNIALDILQQPGVPEKVIGDQRRVRQAISNVTANAIQATNQGSVRVEISAVNWGENTVEVEVAVEDTGIGMDSKKLDDLFAELEQAQSEPDFIVDEDAQQQSITETKDDKKVLGLGLAIVARIVRNMDGQLRLKSEDGKGSRFVLQFPFELPKDQTRQQPLQQSTTQSNDPLSATPPTPKTPLTVQPGGEVTLVEKTGHRKDGRGSPGLSRRNSGGSIDSRKSMTSFKSGKSNASAKSDVDRLIEAMQDPPKSERPSLGERTLSRGSGKSRPGSTSSWQLAESQDRRKNSGSPDMGWSYAPPSVHAGELPIAHSKTPVKAVRVPDELGSPTTERSTRRVTVTFGDSDSRGQSTQFTPHEMHVLVAEDDPINSKIIKRRLDKAGHDTRLTVNGQECANTYQENPGLFDVILMDMQMPFLDGLGSTKLIRSIEQSTSGFALSSRAALNGRVPIIAVSASLVESEYQTYVDAGFDGWILKPISFMRLEDLMNGIVNPTARRNSLYKPGHWEHGGWFRDWQIHVPPPGAFTESTITSPEETPQTTGNAPVSEPQPAEAAYYYE